MVAAAAPAPVGARAGAPDRPTLPVVAPAEHGPQPWGALAAAEVDLLGALAYGELSSFLRLSSEASGAPTLIEVQGVARLAIEHFSRFGLLRARLHHLGVEPEAAMEPFTTALDAFHARTSPSDWTESLVKAYVGDGIAADFYLEVSANVGDPTRRLVAEVLGAAGSAPGAAGSPAAGTPQGGHVHLEDFVVAAVGRASAADPQLSSRLALWGRRLVGEALSQARGIFADHPDLARLLTGAPGQQSAKGADLVEVGALFTRITRAHVHRMGRLGLTA